MSLAGFHGRSQEVRIAMEKNDNMLHRDQIVWQDPDRMSGVPCFTGTRVPIKTLFDYLEGGDSLNEFLDHFPGVTSEQALGALRLGNEVCCLSWSTGDLCVVEEEAAGASTRLGEQP
jgi:uncharacterized protein (DUF433 family)